MGKRVKLPITMLLGALALAAISPLAPSAAAAGSISGTVKEIGSNAPISGTEVCADHYGTGGTSYCATSGADGKYTITGVIEDTYEVEFEPTTNHLRQFYSGKDTTSNLTEVKVGLNEAVAGIDATLKKGASISGTVIDDETEDGIENVLICVTQQDGFYQDCEDVRTASDGTYRVERLPAGEYAVAFLGEEVGYLLKVYDEVFDEFEATLVDLGEGDSFDEADARLEKGTSLAGTVTEAGSGIPLDDIDVCLVNPSDAFDQFECVLTNSSGDYLFPTAGLGGSKLAFSAPLGPEDSGDGYDTQYWNHTAVFADAEVISIGKGDTLTGYDASLTKTGGGGGETHPGGGDGSSSAGGGGAVSQSAPPPASTPKPLKCKKGFKKKRVKGKQKCVKAKKRKKGGKGRHG